MASADAVENRLSLGEQEGKLVNRLLVAAVKWTKAGEEKEQ